LTTSTSSTSSTAAVAATTSVLSGRAVSARRVLVTLTGIFMLGLLAQAYLAGAFLMWDGDFLTVHEALGWSMTYWPFLMLVAALFSKLDRRWWVFFVVTVVLVHIQPLFVFLDREAMGWARALHPLNGVVLVLLTHGLMRGARPPRASEGER